MDRTERSLTADERMTGVSSPGSSGQSRSTASRFTACIVCRAVKAKCDTPEGTSICVRCMKKKEPCERVTSAKGGRPKGSKNQQSSLERAWKVIEKEVHYQQNDSSRKRPRLEQDDQIDVQPIFTMPTPPSYTHSMNPEHSMAASFNHNSVHVNGPVPAHNAIPAGSSSANPIAVFPITAPRQDHTVIPLTGGSYGSQSNHTVEDIHDRDGGLSNPVGLLAEAAEEIGASDDSGPEGVSHVQLAATPESMLPPEYNLPGTLHALVVGGDVDPRLASLGLDTEYLAEGLERLLSDKGRRKLSLADKTFFNPPRKLVKRDLGDEFCPLALSLLTPREVKAFFATFFSKLHPMLPVLDPAIHTPEFVQRRSSFLFTAICAQGASLTMGAEEATKRLRIHSQRLAELMSRRGFVSVEIVQAFLIWISWLPSSVPFQEERLWHETKYAINMAVELGLAKGFDGDWRETFKDPTIAACLEGISIDDWDMVGRIVRNRQRIWLHLFLWDSSLSLAFGKATRFTQDDLIRNESWCFHHLATKADAVTTACVVLRRVSIRLSESLRSESHNRSGSSSSTWVGEKIDAELEPWHSFWKQHCDDSAYLELMYRHTRLWSFSFALQALSARSTSVEALQNDCFTAALSTCEFVCEQLRASKSLWGLPNTMGPMLSFEALLAVRLFRPKADQQLGSSARLFGLLAQLSLLLEQVGSTPPHRLGTAAVYGRHLQVFIRRRIVGLCLNHHQHETGRVHGIRNGAMSDFIGVSSSQIQQSEASITQLLSSNWVSPTDQAQANMTLDGVNTLDFLDTTAGWTDDFFRLFGEGT